MRTDRRIFALGFFDGVHLGHQALLAECCRLAAAMDVQSAAITFLSHPRSLFMDHPPLLLSGDRDRELLLRRYGVGQICKFPVTPEVMSTNWKDFLEQLVENGAVGFVCGDDFRFGHKGEGNAEKLRQFCGERNLPCVILQEQTLEGVRVSSTHIRQLLEAGNMDEAVRFLGHPHVLTGKVVPGRRLGRTIGVPTANILIPDEVVVPRLGVYAAKCLVDGVSHEAVTNIGTRPTVNGHHVTVESWLLDYTGDLYGREITLEFYRFLRPEIRFGSLEELQAEIQKNAEETRKFFGNP